MARRKKRTADNQGEEWSGPRATRGGGRIGGAHFNFDEEAELTNEEYDANLAGKIATLTAADIKRLFPTRVDKERLVELLQIVNSSSSRNQRAAQIQANIRNLSSTILKLLERL